MSNVPAGSEVLNSLEGMGWEVGAIAALIAIVCLLALRRTIPGWRGVAVRLAVVLVAIAATVGYFQLAADRELAAERRALQARQADLAARALTPGLPLACLDGDAGEAVETACEKAIFARPETTAAAIVYVTARLTLLADAQRLAGPDDEDFSPAIAALRRALELDRYGIAAHVLATREGCSVEACRAFAWVEDPTALKANLKAQAFDAYVQRYAAVWNAPAEVVKEADKPPPVAEAPPPSAPAPSSFAGRYDFPSAASIPPVSIMNKEPPRPAEGDTAAALSAAPQDAAAPAAPATRLPPKRPQTQGAATR